MIDGADRWQRFRYVTLPLLKPTMFLVLTLGLIGTWQVFDQIYVMSQGSPAKTTLTPAFLSYRTAFRDFEYGTGAAISFVLFLLIVVLTLLQRWLMRESDEARTAPSRTEPRTQAVMTARRAGAGPTRAALVTSPSSATPSSIFFAPGVPLPVRHPARQRLQDRGRRGRQPAVADPRPGHHRQRSRASSPAPTSRCWLGNSVVVTVIITVGRVFLDSLAGYALARLRFRGRAAVFAAIIALMAVPGVVLLIPKFLVLNQLGIYDSYTALILPLLVDAAGVFIMKQFFESIPVSVEEAARIDGAGSFRTFWSVVLPMARPALITLTILSFQGSWNEFPHTLVAVQDPELFTLPRGLADLVSGSLGAGTQYPLKLGAALLATIPVAIVFLVFQRYFVRGATEGAEKG